MKELFIYAIAPLILSNVLHIIIVKKGLFPFLTHPIATPLFGQNKTWRGFFIVPPLNAFFQVVINFPIPHFPLWKAAVIGGLLGFAYMLFELPNSYLKRRLGIAPGGNAQSNRWLFMLLDKTDSSLGVALFSYYLLRLSLLGAVQLFLLSIITHIFFSWLLVAARIKKSF